MPFDEITRRLQALQDDPNMVTNDVYSPSADDWPGNRLPFVEVHLAYLRSHKHVNPEHYISNLRLMVKKP